MHKHSAGSLAASIGDTHVFSRGLQLLYACLQIEPLPGIQDPNINATNTVVTCGEWLSMRRAAEYGGQPLLAM